MQAHVDSVVAPFPAMVAADNNDVPIRIGGCGSDDIVDLFEVH